MKKKKLMGIPRKIKRFIRHNVVCPHTIEPAPCRVRQAYGFPPRLKAGAVLKVRSILLE